MFPAEVWKECGVVRLKLRCPPRSLVTCPLCLLGVGLGAGGAEQTAQWTEVEEWLVRLAFPSPSLGRRPQPTLCLQRSRPAAKREEGDPTVQEAKLEKWAPIPQQ